MVVQKEGKAEILVWGATHQSLVEGLRLLVRKVTEGLLLLLQPFLDLLGLRDTFLGAGMQGSLTRHKVRAYVTGAEHDGFRHASEYRTVHKHTVHTARKRLTHHSWNTPCGPTQIWRASRRGSGQIWATCFQGAAARESWWQGQGI